MKLYVSNISHSATEGALKELFSEIGEVTSAKIIRDKSTAHSLRSAFVEMPNDADGDAAIKKLCNTSFFSRVLVVLQATLKTESVERVSVDEN